MSSDNKSLGGCPIIVIIGVIASLISIFVFVTGYENIPAFLRIMRHSTVLPESTESQIEINNLPMAETLSTISEKPSITNTNEPLTTYTPSETIETELGVGSTQTSPKDYMIMVYVPEGEFLMGVDSTRKCNFAAVKRGKLR